MPGNCTPTFRTGTNNRYDYSGGLPVSFAGSCSFKPGSNPFLNVFAGLGGEGPEFVSFDTPRVVDGEL